MLGYDSLDYLWVMVKMKKSRRRPQRGLVKRRFLKTTHTPAHRAGLKFTTKKVGKGGGVLRGGGDDIYFTNFYR